MTPVDLATALAGWDRIDLARPYVIGMPQSPNHPRYWHSLPRRHGDWVRADGGSAANDYITLGTHVGTHIDALSHVSQDGVMHGGIDATAAQVGGKFMDLGIHTVAPYVGRAVHLDIPAVRGGALEPGDEVTVAELEEAEARCASPVQPGEAVVIRTGWGARWDEGDAFMGKDTGVPGVGVEGAKWLAARRPFLVGGDTVAFEQIQPGAGHATLPVHRILLVEAGVHIVETMALEELGARGTTDLVLVLIPLPLVGATGSPVRPLALVPGASL